MENEQPAAPVTTEKKSVALSAFTKLVRASTSVEACVSEKAPLPGGLNTTQFGILEALWHLGPLAQCQLLNKVLRTKGSVSVLAEDLRRQGLIQRRRCSEDRRLVYLEITEKGRELMTALFPKVQQTIETAMSALNESEQAQLGELCKKLGKSLEIRARQEDV
jgi:MarR family 2-MHQ and catechol resistance regulon transcriptional repressor